MPCMSFFLHNKEKTRCFCRSVITGTDDKIGDLIGVVTQRKQATWLPAPMHYNGASRWQAVQG